MRNSRTRETSVTSSGKFEVLQDLRVGAAPSPSRPARPCGPPPPLCGATAPPAGGAVGSSTCTPPGAGGLVGPGDGLGIGAALTGANPDISGDTAMPAAIAAALATRLRFIGFRFPRDFHKSNVLVSAYPGAAETNPATPRIDVAIGLTVCCEARWPDRTSTGQLGGGPVTGHCGGYSGTPPPPRGLPPPLRPYRQHFSAGMPGGGPPGSGSKAGTAGGGPIGAAFTSPTPLVNADMQTPAAIAAAAAKRLRFIVRVPPQTSPRWLLAA